MRRAKESEESRYNTSLTNGRIPWKIFFRNIRDDQPRIIHPLPGVPGYIFKQHSCMNSILYSAGLQIDRAWNGRERGKNHRCYKYTHDPILLCYLKIETFSHLLMSNLSCTEQCNRRWQSYFLVIPVFPTVYPLLTKINTSPALYSLY